MQYVIKRNDRYYYNRRVPKSIEHLVDKSLFRIALKTDSKKVAKQRSTKLNTEIENYWEKLVTSGNAHSDERFDRAVNLAKLLGFSFMPMNEIMEKSLPTILKRIQGVKEYKDNPQALEAILGAVEKPELTISKALEVYWSISKNKIMNKSDKQIRKWRNPRKKAIKNFISLIDDMPIEEISRDHLVRFRDWWIGRIEDECIRPSTANKDLIHMKSILQAVGDHYALNIDFQRLFRRLTLEENKKQVRKPFDKEYIQKTLLSNENLNGLNKQVKNLVLALINTGARPSELTGLDKDDINLDDKIPHIVIRPNGHRQLKTTYSERKIPLLGCSLKAFENCPTGFPQYRNKTDTFSNLVNRYFRDNNLLPTEKHSLYSLRHGFQDRLTRSGVNDRMQAELMGHKFNRPLYGDGPTLKQKYECLKGISI
ncbi:MAG: DUF6538 domain-containing protein [Balneola sp.]